MTAAEVDLLSADRPLLKSIAAVDEEDDDGKVGNGNPPAPCPADVPIILIPEEFEAEPALTALCPTPAPICAEVELELTDLEAAVEDDPSAEGYLGTDPVVLVANGCILGGPPAEGLIFKYLLVVGVSGVVKLSLDRVGRAEKEDDEETRREKSELKPTTISTPFAIASVSTLADATPDTHLPTLSA